MSGEGQAPELRVLLEQVRGQLGILKAGQEQQNALLEASLKQQGDLNKEFKARMLKQENCPCQVRRDPGFECPLTNIRILVAKYVGLVLGVTFLFQVALQIALHYFFRR